MKPKLSAFAALATAVCIGLVPTGAAIAAPAPWPVLAQDDTLPVVETGEEEPSVDEQDSPAEGEVPAEEQEAHADEGDINSGTEEGTEPTTDEAEELTPLSEEGDADDESDEGGSAVSPGGIVGYGLVNGSTAKTDYSGSSIAGTALQTSVWYAYVGAGDGLVVDLVTPDDGYQTPNMNGGPFMVGWDKAPLRVKITNPSGTVVSNKTVVTGAGKQLGHTIGAGATGANVGVWKIEIIDGETSDPRGPGTLELMPRLKWNIYVPGKAGSVWTSTLNIGQNWKTSEGPGSDGVEMWAMNNTGKQYKVEAPRFNGIHSTFRLNNLGVTLDAKNADGQCVRQPLSVPQRDASETLTNGDKATKYRLPAGAGTGANQCPNLQPYRLFTKKPHSSLPTTSPGYGWVKPAYVAPDVTDLKLNRTTGVLTGTVTQNMNLIVKIGAKGSQANGFDGKAVTKNVTVTPGTNKQILKWDRKNSDGAVIPFSQDLKVTVTGDGAGYIHLTRTDAEHSNGGVIITDLQTNKVQPVSWDDSKLRTPSGRVAATFTKKVTNGNGANHKWDGTGTSPAVSPPGSWGNTRVINDWVSEAFTKSIDLPPNSFQERPDLLLDKAQVGEPAYAADRKTATVTWKVDVHNAGDAAASNTVMTDVYPTGATGAKIVAQPSKGTFDAATGKWTIGTLAVGETVSVTFSAVLPTTTATSPTSKHVNRAVVSATDLPRTTTGACQVNADLDSDTDQCDEVETPLDGSVPGLKIDKAQVGNPAYAEDRKTATVTWQVSVKSTGNAPAEKVVMKDVYPTGFKTPKQVTAPSHGTFNAETGVWNIGTLKNGTTATVTFSAVIPTADANKTATHTNRAVVSGTDLPRPETGDCQVNANVDADTDQCDEVETPLNGPKPGWSMAKDSDPKSGSEVPAGHPITYTLTVRNTGDVPLTGIELTDTLAKVTPFAKLDGVPQEKVTNGQAVDRPNAISGDKLAWTAPKIPAGQEATLTYTYKLNDDAWGVTVDNAAFGKLTYDDKPLLPDSCGKSDTDPCATDHFTPKWPTSDLPVLGGVGSPAFMLGGAAVVLLSAAAGIILYRRNKRHAAN
ncbi:DUF7927 domain-containing protein [Leucobacter sp. HY1910]